MAVAADEEVVGLYVAVDDLVRMAKVQGAEQLKREFFGVHGVQPVDVAFQILEKRPLHVLEDEVELALAAKYFKQIHDVVMA